MESLSEFFLSFDYISFSWMVALLLLTPLLRTKTLADYVIIPSWCYAAYMSCSQWVYNTFPVRVRMTINYEQMFFMALLAGFALLIKQEIPKDKIRKWLGIVGVVNIFLSIVSIAFDHEFVSGLVPNKSMNGIFNVMLMPYSCMILGVFGWVVNFVLLFTYKSSTAFLTFFCVWLFTIPWTLFNGVVLSLVGLVSSKFIPYLTYDGGRFTGYRFYFQRFQFWDWLIGMGPSSFFAIGTYMHHKLGLPGGPWYWVYLHSDPLQVLFEYGTLGFFLVGAMLWMLYKQAEELEKLSLVAIVSGGLFYYPAHFPTHLIVIFLVLKLICGTKQ